MCQSTQVTKVTTKRSLIFSNKSVYLNKFVYWEHVFLPSPLWIFEDVTELVLVSDVWLAKYQYLLHNG